MQDKNREATIDFEKASEVLRRPLNYSNKSIRVIHEEDEQYLGKSQSNDQPIFEEDDSNNDYLFGNDQYDAPQKKQQPKVRREIMQKDSEPLEIEMLEKPKPLKRAPSRAQSESIADIKKGGKTKYKKEDNVGNEILKEKKLDMIFKSICQPDRTITVNSLGHVMQKFKINFELKDIVEMLKLYSNMTNPESQVMQSDNDQQNLDLSAKMTEAQFRDFYNMIRKKPKK